jgi:hypothetical protein
LINSEVGGEKTLTSNCFVAASMFNSTGTFNPLNASVAELTFEIT